MQLLTLIARAFSAARAEQLEDRDRSERAAIAQAFNDRYCFRLRYFREPLRLLPGNATCFTGHAWMCPECNQIARPFECSVWTGLQYPACCSTPLGHRLGANIRTS